MSNDKVFTTQDGLWVGRPAGQASTTNYTDLYVSHMDQKRQDQGKYVVARVLKNTSVKCWH